MFSQVCFYPQGGCRYIWSQGRGPFWDGVGISGTGPFQVVGIPSG